jgi:hypothetical protein
VGKKVLLLLVHLRKRHTMACGLCKIINIPFTVMINTTNTYMYLKDGIPSKAFLPPWGHDAAFHSAHERVHLSEGTRGIRQHTLGIACRMIVSIYPVYISQIVSGKSKYTDRTCPGSLRAAALCPRYPKPRKTTLYMGLYVIPVNRFSK